jgi:hypothetical protein
MHATILSVHSNGKEHSSSNKQQVLFMVSENKTPRGRDAIFA